MTGKTAMRVMTVLVASLFAVQALSEPAATPSPSRSTFVKLMKVQEYWEEEDYDAAIAELEQASHALSKVLYEKQAAATPGPEAAVLPESTLVEMWDQVRRMHAAGIAHRQLAAETIGLDEDGHPWLLEHYSATVAASDTALIPGGGPSQVPTHRSVP